MRVRLGFIGSQRSCDLARASADSLWDLIVETCPYRHPNEAAALQRKLASSVDAIVFSGLLAYRYRDRSLDSLIPISFVRFANYRVVATLLKLRLTEGIGLRGLSLDIPDVRYLEEIERDLGVSFNRSHVMSYPEHDIDLDALESFHRDLISRGEVQHALTGVHYVHDHLLEQGYSTSLLVDSGDHEREALLLAAQEIVLGRVGARLNAVIRVSGVEPWDAIELGGVHRTAVAPESDTQAPSWAFATTAEQCDAMLPELRQRLRDHGDMRLGIGYAATRPEAGLRAQQAFDRGKAFGIRGLLIDGNYESVGPLEDAAGEDITGRVKLQFTDAELNALAELCRVHVRTLSRVIAFARARNGEPFSAADWAGHHGVAARSAERLVRKLVDGGALEEAGRQQSFANGRPRELYRVRSDLLARPL